MKPWEKYQALSETKREPGDVGPWTKYEKEATVSEPGLLDTALATVDKYAGAPMRAGYGKFQDSLFKKGMPMDVAGVAKAAYDQLGKDPAEAPTAEQLVDQNPIGRQLNRPEVKEAFASSPAALGVRGLMAPLTGWDRSGEIVGEVPKQAANLLVAGETDPLSYVPGAVFEKPLVKGLQLGGKALSSAGKFGAYLAENTTGIPRQVWSNYAGRAKEIGKLAKDYVGDNRYMQAYTDFRNQVGEAIAGRKNQLNEMIDQGLGGASRGSKISITPIIEELDTSMRGLHPVTEKAAIDEIQALKNKVREIAPEGKMSPWDAYKLQRFFHDRSMKAFAEGGQLFNPSSQAARAAKSARYKTTEMVNQFFPDTIKKANQQFVSLHNIDDMIPPSMLDPNGSAAALRRASLDPNSKERKPLSQLSQFLHGDDRLVQQAMDLSTFEKMTNLPLNPLSGGGTTSTSRTLLGGGVGLLGEASEDPEAKWAARAAGAMIASPALLKMGLDAGLMVPNAAKKIGGKGGLLEKGVEKTSEKMSPIMKSLEKRLQSAGKTAKDFIDDEEGKFSPEDLLNILKPNEENVFDLKKARGLVGEPKRGLLEPKDNPVAKYRPPLSKEERGDLLNWIDSAYNSLRRGEKFKPVDEQYLREVLPVAPDYQKKYVKDLLEQIEKQKAGGAEEIARSMGGRPEIPGVKTPAGPHSVKQGDVLYRASNPDGGELRVLEYDPTTDNYLVDGGIMGKSWRKSDELVASKPPKGLLTSLDVERGPVTERPEAGGVKFFESPNVEPNPWNSTGQIFKAKSGPIAGQEFTVLPVTKEVRRDGDLLMEVRLKDGSIKQMTKDEIFWSMRPDTDSTNIFASTQTLADKEARIAKYGEQHKEFTQKQNVEKAAEAERAKKGLIGVDFGGRGGKMPKAKPKTALDRYAELKDKADGVSDRVNQRMAAQEKNHKQPPSTEEIFKFFESQGVTPKPIYEKNGVKIYTKDSNSFGDQIIHYSVGDGPRKTETFGEGGHMDFDTFADIYGTKTKPKGGKGKPKKKK